MIIAHDDADSPEQARSREDWQAAVLGCERRGTLFFAYDVASRALQQPELAEDPWFAHRAVLALARAGASEAAWAVFVERGLQARAGHDVEVAALGARLIKDRAWRAHPAGRAVLLREAAEAYEGIHRRAPDAYPAVNAATLWLLAGNAARARALAAETLALLDAAEPPTGLAGYYDAATRAEAALVLGALDEAALAIRAASSLAVDDLAARASTRKQLRRLIQALGAEQAMLRPLAPGPVLHYCGVPLAGPVRGPAIAAGPLDALRREVAAALRADPPAAAYGCLSAGADLLFAEALLDSGAELNVVLPFDREEFLAVAVAPAGPGWVHVFERVLAALDAQQRVFMVTEDGHLGDDSLYLYAQEFAMGLAILRARHIDADVRQLSLAGADPGAAASGACLSSTLEAWQLTGLARQRLDWTLPAVATAAAAPSAAAPRVPRVRRALLFGDFKHFSKLPDRLLPVYVEHVLGAVRSVLDRHTVLFRNTWGDAVYLVFEDVAPAVACALELQRAMAGLAWTELGFTTPLQLRLGGHYGPVYQGLDPVLGASTFFGAHVSRAARVEPMTPPGGVYVTEHFATKLALYHGGDFECEYVGVREAPKNFGYLPLSLVRESR